MRPGLSTHGIVQVAYAVDDVAVAAVQFATAWGAGPFFVASHIPLVTAHHRGRDAVFDHSSAYGQWGDVMVELVHVHAASPSALRAAVTGRAGIHHIARFVPDLDEASATEEGAGHPLVLDALTPVGVRFRFHDARHDLGHLVELYEPAAALVDFYARVADAAAGWDGTDPVRTR